MDVKKNALKGTTQQHLPIEDITDNMVILKDGSCTYIFEVSSVNFDLLSEREQEAMIYAYASLINSLSFPLQIFIHSALKDVTSYLEHLLTWEQKKTDPLVKKQIAHYRQFVSQMVEKNNVLTKSFYVAIPFSSLELGVSAVKSAIPFLSFLKPKQKEGLPIDKKSLIDRARANLEPKKEHIIRALGSLGLRVRQLKTPQLVAFFYSVYNQEKISTNDLPLKEGEVPVVLVKDINSKIESGEAEDEI
ncbi:hypothetical protein ISS42_00915 [Candidatus Shapirobacteria bacterium]|nr:hypothetical protein [Candidatus Shapirobacteria bacterium]